jgi:hypothetical protein
LSRGFSRADDDDCRPLIGVGGADEAVVAVFEQPDRLLDERLVMVSDRVDALRQEVLERCG